MRSRLFYFWALVVACLAGSTAVAAQGSTAKLKELLSVAHYYVISYTVWPKNDEIRLCISNQNRLKETITSVFENRSSANRKFIVRELSSIEKPETECDAVILSDDTVESSKLLARLESHPVLTLSSEIDFTGKGGMVYLPQGKPPRILLSRVTKAGLKIESSLLEISEIVQ